MKEENIYHNLYSLIPFLPKPLYEEDMENLKDTVDTFVARLKRYNGDGKFDGRIDEILYEFEKWKENPDAYNRNHNIAGAFDKENKEVFKSKENNEIAIPVTQNEGRERIYNSQVIYPIISDGDVIGSVILMAKEPSKKMGEAEYKVAQSAAGFLGNHLEV